MSERSSADVGLALWGGYNILPQLTRMGWAQSRTTEENYKLAQPAVTFGDVGLSLGALDLAGFFDDGARAIAAAFDALGPLSKAVLFNFSGNVFGRLAMGGSGACKGEHRIETARGEFVKCSGSAQSVGTIDPWLNILLPLAVYTADETGANFDDDHIATSAGGVLHVQCTEWVADGSTGAKITVLQGDGATMVAIPNCNHTFTAEDGVRVPVDTGTVGTIVRADLDLLGTPGDDTAATVVAAWARG